VIADTILTVVCVFLREKLNDLKADVILSHCKIVNVLTKEIHQGDIAVKNGVIVGVGDVEELRHRNTLIRDVGGGYVAPGFIDGHVHFESSMVTLTEFARCALKHGTTAVVIDPHEVANVLGVYGVRCVLEEASHLPLKVFVMVPSCVPATGFETSGASITLEDAKELFEHENVIGLGEMMDYPDVITGKPERVELIHAALERGLRVDGHAPGLGGTGLWKYLLAGVSSDHESITFEEALEKARLGMTVMLREGSASKTLSEFIPRIIREGVSFENFFLVSDDINPYDLSRGYMDRILRRVISLGVEPVEAISLCTLNTARHYRIDHLTGSISVGRRADLVVFEDLKSVRPRFVLAGGKPLGEITPPVYPSQVFQSMKLGEITPADLCVHAGGDEVVVKVIGVVPGSLYTEKRTAALRTSQGVVLPAPEQDVLSIAVVERYGGGNLGRGFISGFGLKQGAFAQSIAHDSHNIITVGADHKDMSLCVNTVRKMGGGVAVGCGGEILCRVPLPYAGLLATERVVRVASQIREARRWIRRLGCGLSSPITALSFMALPVVPRLKITDKGLFDVEEFEHVEVLTG
jgi:adenine deaminase